MHVPKWSAPVAKQHRIRSLPHIKLYGPDGRLLRQGGSRLAMQIAGGSYR